MFVMYVYFIYISQGSVETLLWCGGIHNNQIIAYCPQSVKGKKVKVSICIAHLAYPPLMCFSSLTRAVGRTTTVCSLHTQASAVAG